ncbi:MAG: hypothetical protein ACLPUO_06035 [Streptosporangiaceae bacterium]
MRATANIASEAPGILPRDRGEHGEGEVDVRLRQRPPARLGGDGLRHSEAGRARGRRLIMVSRRMARGSPVIWGMAVANSVSGALGDLDAGQDA